MNMEANSCLNDLSSLPDYNDLCVEKTMLDNGETMLARKVPPLIMQLRPEVDEPFLFNDEYGTWEVVYGHIGGPHKRLIKQHIKFI